MRSCQRTQLVFSDINHIYSVCIYIYIYIYMIIYVYDYICIHTVIIYIERERERVRNPKKDMKKKMPLFLGLDLS